MARKITIGGTVTGCKLDTNRQLFKQYLTEVDDGEVLITVESTRRAGVSSQQRRYWYGCVVPFVVQSEYENGNTAIQTTIGELTINTETISGILKSTYCERIYNESTGEFELQTLTKMSPADFQVLLTKIDEFCMGRYGYTFPSPEKFGLPNIVKTTN